MKYSVSNNSIRGIVGIFISILSVVQNSMLILNNTACLWLEFTECMVIAQTVAITTENESDQCSEQC